MEYRVCGPELERGRDDWSVATIPIPEAWSGTIHPVPVELVLRRRDGSFLPVPYLLNTFCHEVCSDRSCSCIGITSHLSLRCFYHAISFPILNPLMTPLSLSFTPLARPGRDYFSTILTRKSLLMIACTRTTDQFVPFHFTSSWRISNT